MIGSSLSPIVMPSSLEVVLVPKHEQQLIISLTRIYLFWIFKPEIQLVSSSIIYLSDASCHQLFCLIILIIIWPKRTSSYIGFFLSFGLSVNSTLSPAPHESFFYNMRKQQKIYFWKTCFLWAALAGAAGVSQLLGISMRLAYLLRSESINKIVLKCLGSFLFDIKMQCWPKSDLLYFPS